jgi:ribosomal protein L22
MYIHVHVYTYIHTCILYIFTHAAANNHGMDPDRLLVDEILIGRFSTPSVFSLVILVCFLV